MMKKITFILLFFASVFYGQENNISSSDFSEIIGDLSERNKNILNNIDQIKELIERVGRYADAVQKNMVDIENDQSIKNKHEELERIHLSPQKIREKFVEKARSDVDKMLAGLLVLSSEMENEIVDSITHSNKYRTKLSTITDQNTINEIRRALDIESKNQEDLKLQQKQLKFLIDEIRLETYVLFDYTYIDLIFYLYSVEKDLMEKLRENLNKSMKKIDGLVKESNLIPNYQTAPSSD